VMDLVGFVVIVFDHYWENVLFKKGSFSCDEVERLE